MAQEEWNGIETLTVEQFKDRMKVERIRVLENPKTGKIFFAYGAKRGAVSSKGIPHHPMLTAFPGKDNPFEVVWVMHEESTGGAPELAVF